MTEWYEQPYKGGPMIAVPGFPRPLYPPDANTKGKQPSVSGPDVEAYKRVVWRLGRWPGPASGFDQAFSNNFSHGKGGNVVDTGVAGMQRQAKIEDSGWIGEPTFNLMRSVRIPEGCPGPGVPGDYAMDAYAQSLLVHAWERFGGKEPAPEPPPEKSLRQQALAKAITQIGTKESPPNSNVTPYTKWYGAEGPWCAMFVTWCFEQSGNSPSFAKGQDYAYVPYIVGDARSNKNGLFVTGDPIPGDLVCYDWEPSGGVFDHVGIFEAWISGRSFTCIEGNTAVGNDSDGGEVMRRSRDAGSSYSVVFCRVKEA
jgi:hypothetical protein